MARQRPRPAALGCDGAGAGCESGSAPSAAAVVFEVVFAEEAEAEDARLEWGTDLECVPFERLRLDIFCVCL